MKYRHIINCTALIKHSLRCLASWGRLFKPRLIYLFCSHISILSTKSFVQSGSFLCKHMILSYIGIKALRFAVRHDRQDNVRSLPSRFLVGRVSSRKYLNMLERFQGLRQATKQASCCCCCLVSYDDGGRV